MFRIALFFSLVSSTVWSQTDSLGLDHDHDHDKFIQDVHNIYFNSDEAYLLVQSCDSTGLINDESLRCLTVDSLQADGTYRLLLVDFGTKKGLANYAFILLVEPIAIAPYQDVITVDYQRQVLREVYFGIRDNILLELGEEMDNEPR
ncbi:hypothetical protein [Phaeocystidibacter luteus]|uniref:Uncharacterized protein n=1 Tax=Phaeocystidibacter luteus TaxID=911197 RepID=A0A6N6RFK6_9FLAO|nr:hypothetical protein [Phaeocystidibacter luteus]KAB2809932.1 hypothetical protein F8C67_08605 [Phaeocystidibacter luteus]